MKENFGPYTEIDIDIDTDTPWHHALNNPIDITVGQFPDLTIQMKFDDIKSLKTINAYKAVYSPEDNPWHLHFDRHRAPYVSHFGSLDQARERFSVMEEDDWRIYKVTLDLSKFYPHDVLYDTGSTLDKTSRRLVKNIMSRGYTTAAYYNNAEAYDYIRGGGYSILALHPSVILRSPTAVYRKHLD